jgi:pilus assembly protein CpaB
VVSLALAAVGTLLLVRYVQGAEDRELAGQELVEVLVVDDVIEPGTPAEDLQSSVTVIEVPQHVAAEGVFSSVDDFEGLVPIIELVPGEQVVVSRFITAEEYAAIEAQDIKVDIPTDKLEVTLSLEPDRAVGGELQPGDVVAVFASFNPFALTAVEPSEPGEIPVIVTTDEDEEDGFDPGLRTPNSTKIILHQVLVTNVQAEELPAESSEDEEQTGYTPDLAPTGNLLITLALDPVSAERVVFTAEHGTVWLAREGPNVDQADTEIQTRNIIYENEPR